MSTENFEKIEELIAQGQSVEARHLLQKLIISKIPRNRLSQVADLCRRAGLPELALKILKPVVRAQNNLVQATPAEMAQYGQSLVSVGGSEEAIKLLNDPKVIDKEVKALLFLSFAHFAQWDYHSALPHLETYLSRVDPTTYTHCVGQVNYAAALIAVGDFNQAEKTLLPLIDFFDEKNHRILAGNCRELLAQIHYYRQELEKASHYLHQAIHLLGGKQPDTLFVMKWQLLIKIRQEGMTETLREEVGNYRKLVKEKLHWETLRDLDFQLSLILKDQNLFNQVYFGTPFPRLREKMRQQSQWLSKQTFIRNINDATQLDLFVDVQQLDRGPHALFKTGSLYHRLFLELCKDFYRPQRLPTLFSKLYPSEYFDPEYSSQKVKMLISRLRKIIAPLHLEVVEIEGTGYTLGSKKSLGLVYREKENIISLDLLDSRLQRIQEVWSGQNFKSQDVAEIFNISPRSASRWLKEMVEKGHLKRHGDKKGATYSLPKVAA